MQNKLLKLNIGSYILSAIYILLLCFAPLGSLTVNFGDIIVYFREPDSGGLSNVDINFSPNLVAKIFLISMLIIELMLIHSKNIKAAVASIVLSIIRAACPLPYIVLGLFSLLDSDLVVVNVTLFGCLIILVCIALVGCNILRYDVLRIQNQTVQNW